MISKVCALLLVVCIAQSNCVTWNPWASRGSSAQGYMPRSDTWSRADFASRSDSPSAWRRGSLDSEPEKVIIDCLQDTKQVRERINCVDQRALHACSPGNARLLNALSELNNVQRELAGVYNECLRELQQGYPPKPAEIRSCCDSNIAEADRQVDEILDIIGEVTRNDVGNSESDESDEMDENEKKYGRGVYFGRGGYSGNSGRGDSSESDESGEFLVRGRNAESGKHSGSSERGLTSRKSKKYENNDESGEKYENDEYFGRGGKSGRGKSSEKSGRSVTSERGVKSRSSKNYKDEETYGRSGKSSGRGKTSENSGYGGISARGAIFGVYGRVGNSACVDRVEHNYSSCIALQQKQRRA